jgi:hypothetical protein
MIFAIVFAFLSISLLGFTYAATDGNFDLTVKTVTVSPSSPDAGDTITVKCTIESLGEDKVKFDDLEITFYMDDGEDQDDYDIIDNDVTFTGNGDTEKYEYDFKTNIDFEGTVDFGCEITDYSLDNDYDTYDDLNINNDTKMIDVEFESVWDSVNGIDLGIYDVDVDDDTVKRGQEIVIDCTYANFGNDDADSSDGDTKLYWLVDGEEINYDTIGDVDSGSKKTKTNFYQIPENYFGDEMEIGCQIDWDPDDSDYKDEENNNDDKFIIIDVSGDYSSTNTTTSSNNTTINNSNPNLIVSNLNLVTLPAIINQSNIIRCVVQNFSAKKITEDYTISAYVDNVKAGERVSNTDIEPSSTYTFDLLYAFPTSGNHSVKCNVAYKGTELSTVDNVKEQMYYVTNPYDSTQPGYINNNSNNYNNINPVITAGNSVAKMNAVSASSISNKKSNVTCTYSNTGDATMDSYSIRVTLNNALKSSETINVPLAANASGKYVKEIDVGYAGGTVGCSILNTATKQTSTAYVKLSPLINNSTILIIIIGVIVIGILIYLIVRR